MRSPLALIETVDRRGNVVWKSVQTANCARGTAALRIVLFRDPTPDEQKTLEPCLKEIGKMHRIWDLFASAAYRP